MMGHLFRFFFSNPAYNPDRELEIADAATGDEEKDGGDEAY